MRSYSVHETENIARELASKLCAGTRVIALSGELGAGKTAFARGLAKGLGYGGHVSSPTYAIVNEYTDTLFHFDWYRLSGLDELFDLGWDEYLERGLCIVEWGDRAPSALPPQTVYITLSRVEGEPEFREISIGNGGLL